MYDKILPDFRIEQIIIKNNPTTSPLSNTPESKKVSVNVS